MYIDPKVLYREYIQNAIDSIDDATEKEFLHKGRGQIYIQLDKKEQRIIIEDNGSGVPNWQAKKLLLDIGNSCKSHKKSRGFRGIGRLVGLSYSTSLTFQTSFPGEALATEIRFDSKKLHDLLLPGQHNELDLAGVLSEVTSHRKYTESLDLHYFRVILDGVHQDDLLDESLIHKYISETAPVPYDPDLFSWGSKVHMAFSQCGLELQEYPIYISDDNTYHPIYKSFRDQILVDKQKKLLDTTYDIDIHKVITESGNLSALVWYSKTTLLGGIINDSIKGLRFRKGNILIGDRSTLNGIFKEERFNGWYQGEIFVLDENIIPNARRDNFENNHHNDCLLKELRKIGDKLSKEVRVASAVRARIRINDFTKINSLEIDNEDEHFLMADTKDHLQSTQNFLRDFQSMRQLRTSQTKYAALDASNKLSQSERKILEKVFDVIMHESDKDSGQRIIETIIDELRLLC